MSRPLGVYWAGWGTLAFFLVVAAGLVARPARGLPLIAEVFYDAVGSDNGHSFVELYGVPGASLEGVNGAGGGIGPRLDLSGVIGSEGLFVIADDLGDGTTLVSNADAIANFDFQNGPDASVSAGSTGVHRWRKTFMSEGVRDEPDSAEVHSDPPESSP